MSGSVLLLIMNGMIPTKPLKHFSSRQILCALVPTTSFIAGSPLANKIPPRLSRPTGKAHLKVEDIRRGGDSRKELILRDLIFEILLSSSFFFFSY